METTIPSLRTLGQCCVAVTQRVSERLRPKSDEEVLGSDRKYGDGDEDPDREKLAQEVMSQLEKEKQIVLRKQSSLEDKNSQHKNQEETKKEGDNNVTFLLMMHIMVS